MSLPSDKINAAYNVFLRERSTENFKNYKFEYETNAEQYLNPDRIKEYLHLVNSKEGCEGVKSMMHYILIVAAKHLTIMTSYHIQENDKEAVERTFAWFNTTFQTYQVIYKQITGKEAVFDSKIVKKKTDWKCIITINLENA